MMLGPVLPRVCLLCWVSGKEGWLGLCCGTGCPCGEWDPSSLGTPLRPGEERSPWGGHPGYLACGAVLWTGEQGAGQTGGLIPATRQQASEQNTPNPTTLRGEGGKSGCRDVSDLPKATHPGCFPSSVCVHN